ncbi:unnamed protein product [Auanema sp. JU1783]|nr:unnamed protein product [Auanema sp. JU1783]
MSGVREETTSNGIDFNSGPSVSQPNTTRTTPDSGLGDDRNQQDRARQIPPGFQQQPNPPPAQQGNFYPPLRMPHQQFYYSNSDNHYDYKNSGHKVGHFDAPETGRIYEHQHMVHPSNPRAVVYRSTMNGQPPPPSMHYDDNYHQNQNGPPNMGPNAGPGLLGGPPVNISGRVPSHGLVYPQPPTMPQNMPCPTGQYEHHYVHNQQMQHPPAGAVLSSSSAVSSGYENEGPVMQNTAHAGTHPYYSQYPQNVISSNGVMMYPPQAQVMMSAQNPVGVFMAPPPVLPPAPGQPVMMLPHQQYVGDGTSNPTQLYLVQAQQQMRQSPGMPPTVVVRQPNVRGDRSGENQMDALHQNVSQPPPSMMTAPPTRFVPVPQSYYVNDQQPMPSVYPTRMALPQGQQSNWIPAPGVVSYMPSSFMPNHYSRGGRFNRPGRGGNSNYNRDGKGKSYSRQSSVSTDHGIQKSDHVEQQNIINLQQLALDASSTTGTENEEQFSNNPSMTIKEDESSSLPDEPTQPSPKPIVKEFTKERQCSIEDPSQKQSENNSSQQKDLSESSKKVEAIKHCTYCRSNGKPETEYTGHTLRENGKVRCPDALVNLECGYCHLRGGVEAHATPFCPKLQEENKLKKENLMYKDGPPRHTRDQMRPYQGSQQYEHRQSQQYPGTRGGQNRRNSRPSGRKGY